MASLMELVERVNKGENIDPGALEIYQESPNSAEKFLAHHAQAMLDLRRAHQHMLQSLEAIDYSDQKVLNQFVSVSSFLGHSDLRTQAMVRFGGSAIARREYALGLEAIQNGIWLDSQAGGSFASEQENAQLIASQIERASQGIGWTGPDSLEWNNRQLKIAYITSGIADDDSSGRILSSLAKHHDSKRFKLVAYSTESNVRRDKQQFAQNSYVPSSSKRGKDTLDSLNRQKISVWLSPTEGDSVSAARALADQMIKDKIDVAIFDSNQGDPIASLVASWQTARVKINLARRSALLAGGIDCVMYVDQNRFEQDKDWWNRKGVDSKFILEGIDMEEVLGPAPQRSAYGIPEQAIVMATSSNDLDQSLSGEFVETIINILRAHPHAIYLVTGEGDLAWQKRKFESAGVSKRIGYANRRKDLPGFLRIADLYLAEFPGASSQGVLQAMAMERPVVAMHAGDGAEQSQASIFAGSDATIPTHDAGAYLERVSKLIREAGYRQKLGKMMRGRAEQHFSFAQTVRHIEQLCEQLIQQRSGESDESQVRLAANDEPIANVA